MAHFSNFKYEFIRTPLEQPLMRLREAAGYFHRRKHPELREVFLEGDRIEALWKRILRRDSNCIDAGCHYGSMLSRFCGLAPEGKHLAVEAIPNKIAFLRRKFPEVDVRHLALSDTPGTASFYIDLEKTGFSGLAQHTTGNFEKIEVTCERLDRVASQDRHFDVLKVDVEGAELPLFRGAIEFLKRDQPIVLFECGPSGPPAFGYTAGDLHDFFVAQNYSVFFLKDALEGGSPVSRDAFEAALIFPFKALNWVAVPDTRIREVIKKGAV
ncbi:FkbM family methyltransferase [Paracidobacterium acidisoli]|uniref:FkbM family methyltransferase n=1 Tax=Paracidobacterium acidisoli TaxID=2303751 RepID=A0A372IMX4_9BACT|nr:FkbM family methyltransferase [Paracidobacterium acidisoli]MBT9332559.1 FkbM family methyltransferase [Paracidobacterium acidisoli]